MGRKTHLKLRICQEKDMSKEGFKHWNRKARPKIHKKVYPPVLFIQVPVEEIESTEAIGRWAFENLWTGKFLLFGYSHGKTPTHVKLVLLCKFSLKIDKDGEKYRCIVSNNWRLARYWFWRK